MDGRELYVRWLAASYGSTVERAALTDSAGYFNSMNPTNRRGWDRLAAQLDAAAFDAQETAILNSLVTYALEHLPMVTDEEREVALKVGRAALAGGGLGGAV